ncbi:MAG: ABC transporter substrate-binding protein [Acuticoccus sp.]
MAQERLAFAGFGGSMEKMLTESIFPEFEEANGVEIEYVVGNSTGTLAKLQAQKGNQQIDVAIMDDGPIHQAVALGFCAPIEGFPADEIYPSAQFPDHKASGLGFNATGIVYNAEYFEEQGWAPPTAWADLADPKYKGKLVIPPINNTYGLLTAIHFAKAGGGGEGDMEPAFEAFKGPLGDNVLVFEPSSGKLSELLSTGEVVIATWGTTRAKAFSDTGFPIAFVYPEEGVFAHKNSICPIAKEEINPLAMKLVTYLLSPEVQTKMSEIYGYGPVNMKAEAIEDDLVPLPIGERAAALTTVDWEVMNQHRADYNRRWVREVER